MNTYKVFTLSREVELTAEAYRTLQNQAGWGDADAKEALEWIPVSVYHPNKSLTPTSFGGWTTNAAIIRLFELPNTVKNDDAGWPAWKIVELEDPLFRVKMETNDYGDIRGVEILPCEKYQLHPDFAARIERRIDDLESELETLKTDLRDERVWG